MQPFNYIVPALSFYGVVDRAVNLGNTSSGSSLGLFQFKTITLISEPGFEIQLNATISNVNDYSTTDVEPSITHPRFTGMVSPDDESLPFQLEMTGILFNDKEISSIISEPPPVDDENVTVRREIPYGTLYRVLTATFTGGDAKYEGLTNSIFVASETVSDGDEPKEYLVGIKLSKVYTTKTNVTIGKD